MNLINSLFFKIFAGFWLLILILVAILVTLPKLEQSQPQLLDLYGIELLDKTSHALFSQITRHPERSLKEAIEKFRHPSRFKLYAMHPDGRFLNDHVPKPIRRFVIDSENISKPMMWKSHKGIVVGPISFYYNQEPLLLYAYKNLNHETNRLVLRWLLDNPGLLILITLLVSTPVCLLLAWHLTSPLRQLQKASDQIAKGQLDTQIPQQQRKDEIGELANGMDHMVLSLKNMLAGQQRLLSDISHELRSPLTRLRLALAISKKTQGESAELARIDTEADRLEQMIADLLGLARNQFQPQDIQTVQLDSLLEELLADAHFEAEQKGKQFIYKEPPAIELRAYPGLISSAIENVIRNAIKYASNTIKFDCQLTQKQLIITIADDGPGIPEHEIAHIFRPFYRVSEARDRESGGTGLGLAICDNAMHKHGGTVSAHNGAPGLVVTLTLPV